MNEHAVPIYAGKHCPAFSGNWKLITGSYSASIAAVGTFRIAAILLSDNPFRQRRRQRRQFPANQHPESDIHAAFQETPPPVQQPAVYSVFFWKLETRNWQPILTNDQRLTTCDYLDIDDISTHPLSFATIHFAAMAIAANPTRYSLLVTRHSELWT